MYVIVYNIISISYDFYKLMDKSTVLTIASTDSTFTPNNIIDILKDVEDWKTLADLLKHTDILRTMPNIEELHEELDMEVMIKQWHMYHPHASWSVLHQALLRMEEKETAIILSQNYQLKGMNV